MAMMVYFFFKIVWIYIFSPEFVRNVKIPPIMPLVPYLPSVFKLDFLPPFYFIYWIIILAVVAIPHEFAHGIYAAYNKVRIKTTGFAFLPYFFPVFLAAFVELDEKELSKKSNFGQLATLSAGTFANVLTAIFFFIVLWVFFSAAYVPSGAVFDTYPYASINVSQIQSINNISINHSASDAGVSGSSQEVIYGNMLDIMDNSDNINEITLKIPKGKNETEMMTFWTSKELFKEPQNRLLFEEEGRVVVFYDSPAVRAGLTGAIYEIDGVKINNRDNLISELNSKSPGQTISISTYSKEQEVEGVEGVEGVEYTEQYNITLGEHPEAEGVPWLGVAFLDRTKGGVMGRIASMSTAFRQPGTYYKPRFGGFSDFIYNLLWWIVLVCFSIALINMLPIGMFDGGRFFFLTVAAITGSKKIARKAFGFVTLLFIFLILLILSTWAWSMFG
ncbi:hypothetical protein GF378_00575 [Candidatus Pacearchaeota archaeon]|nr:hypothetical protein [Candidatus Pacearchaeota archaeon]